MTPAFVGISLDSRAFTRSWVRSALTYILARHDRLLLILADALFVYTRTAEWSESREVRLHLEKASAAAEELAVQRNRFFSAEIARLDGALQGRVRLANWSTYSDAAYAGLWRRLWIAYSVLPRFKLEVDEIAHAHSVRVQGDQRTPSHPLASAAYILDELAMCMRITELEGHHDEYHPSPDLPLATSLYAGAFANEGLSVESLVGARQKRRFILLDEPAFTGPLPHALQEVKASVG